MAKHEYRKIGRPKNSKLLIVEMEPKTIVCKFAMMLKKDVKTNFDHLPQEKHGDLILESIRFTFVSLTDAFGMKVLGTLISMVRN